MTSYLMTPPTIPRKRARQSAENASFEPLLATPELVNSPSNASFESAEPSTPTSQRFSTALLPPTPRFTRTQTPQSKTVVPPSPSPAARFRKAYLEGTIETEVPVTPFKIQVAISAPPATPLHQRRRALTPHTPSPVTAAPGVFGSAPAVSSDDLPFRVTPFARASIHRASTALQDLLFDADPFLDHSAQDDMDMDVDEAFGPSFSTPQKVAPLTPEPEVPCTPPRQVRRGGIPRSPRHWNLVSAVCA
ncbi:hypothetical protein CcaverHIS002_0410280 [Cutaneotrichosporon cavernicola]|uniref:Uncharacterized protein n=1 Tax=Cutaneotrichosporon cavernicola TaxID=279322 RepID=A0AA48L5A2_9TREE|nr:uncharacterized protein CcaverHIS019_0410180 [Cutaneotrichosporon cavernicola]BEI84424.1 hypothetical protein CcaverHIS002_0410280 [Cutaneotrichosporon cavernicola]BEI92198.1 hypothetical protein CcaverHIS019_0410180 [Cutaneotrichosporon cavernicola]BEI99969.1 hypothetical protein CcaverHIS631_0410120 [Cutaneotrichosporon cavernicola]BEJ07742.1 hypothetical protein CcaverHIS641_0410110 [Cutaneotrichosporon cavernicola]